MGQQRYAEKFRREAVRKVVEQGHAVKDVAERLGVSNLQLVRVAQEEAASIAGCEPAGEQG